MKKQFTSAWRVPDPLPVAVFPFLLLILWFAGTPYVKAQTCNPNQTVLSITGPLSQTWTAPTSGGPWQVRINATGGGGGGIDILPGSGGTGATMSGTFVVQNGETLRAIAGGPGGTAADVAGGGGGGSGVVNCGNPSNCSLGTIWIIAAAGSGEGDANGVGGSAATNGGGNGGNGGGDDSGGGGGGQDDSGLPGGGSGGGGGGTQVSKLALATGGTGSTPGDNDGGNGMGGGGGGGDNGPGGGGGHTGGNGGDGGAAASSLNTGDDQTNADGEEGVANNGTNGTTGTISIVCLGVLPVELINIKAMIHDSEVMLLWSTASEKDNLGFDVERSADNRNWSSLGFVPGNGTTAHKNEYAFRDDRPYSGVNYYRLKQMDSDGKSQYTPMVVADVRNGSAAQFDVFPNPSVNGEVTFRVVNKREGNALLEIYDWAGYKLYRETLSVPEGTMVYPVSLATYAKGAYTARLEMPDGQVLFKKILLQ